MIFVRLFRDRAGDDSCPDHGPLRGQTRCRFCGYDPIPPRTATNEFDNYIPVPESGCWLWLGSVDGAGYPRIQRTNRQIGVHRAVYELHHGPIPPGAVVCHSCDIPTCVNPAHLFVGSHADNQRDMVKKGRARASGPKLTPEQRQELLASKEPTSVLASRFGIAARSIRSLRAHARKVAALKDLPLTASPSYGGVSSLLSARREVFTPLQVQQDVGQPVRDVQEAA